MNPAKQQTPSLRPTKTAKPSRRKRRPMAPRLHVELLEARCVLDVRTITGVGNNIGDPTLGAGNTDLLRESIVAYTNAISAASQPNTINPRHLSNVLNNQSDPIFSFDTANPQAPFADNLGGGQEQHLSDFSYVWGQFTDHDLDLTLDNSGDTSLSIQHDPTNFGTATNKIFDPMGVETFTRSNFDPTTGNGNPTTLSVMLGLDFNRLGIVNDGSTFGGGFDGDGFALSAQKLGGTVTFNGQSFIVGDPGGVNVIRAAGQVVELGGASPATTLSFLAAGVNGNQANQSFIITYSDGTTQTFTRSISDWATPQHFSGESIAKTMPYRDVNNGTTQALTVYVYGYTVTLSSSTKTVQSITLPNNGNVNVLAIDLAETTNPRQQVNTQTSFEDLSQVYGATAGVASALRVVNPDGSPGAKLRTGPGDLLPTESMFTAAELATLNHDEGGIANDAHQVPDSQLFVAGDKRVNENIELTAMHTVFMRNHNRLVDQLHALHPTWSDEQLYQEARKLNIAEAEMVTYNEFLPAIFGVNLTSQYTGYNPNIDPAISTEFSTVGFRFGHTLLSNAVGRLQNNGLDINTVDPNGAAINLTIDFFQPNLINNNHVPVTLTDLAGNQFQQTSSTVGEIMKADASNAANSMDLRLIDEIRNVLFGVPTGAGTDLAARDVQRARDHGIGTYNQVRVAFGLARVTSYAQISSDPAVQAALAAAYGTFTDSQGVVHDNVDAIDPFEGMLAEDHLPGTDAGPTMSAIVLDQFRRLMLGDRFFFLNENFNTEEKTLLAQGNTLAKIIMNNTSITNLQANVFFFREEISGTVFNDANGNGVRDTGEAGIQGVTVNLLDSTGAVIASTVTDVNGEYDFTDLTGIPGTGRFSVSINMPAGYTQNLTEIGHDPGIIFLTRGGLDVTGQNFAIMFQATPPQTATHFAFVKLSSAHADVPFEFVLVALDANNQVVTNFSGTVHFTSSDSQASLPGDYTFVLDDGGQHHFFVTFGSTGNQTLTATDAADGLVGSLVVDVLA
jgi:hypothetical protein